MWSVGKLESKTFYVGTGKFNSNGKEITFPVTVCKLPLTYTSPKGHQENWYIGVSRGRFSLIYPDTYQDIDKWGFHRPNGKRVVHHKETGLDAQTLMERLYAKFDKAFVKKIVVAMNAA